jgi:hypothetical protein
VSGCRSSGFGRSREHRPWKSRKLDTRFFDKVKPRVEDRWHRNSGIGGPKSVSSTLFELANSEISIRVKGVVTWTGRSRAKGVVGGPTPELERHKESGIENSRGEQLLTTKKLISRQETRKARSGYSIGVRGFVRPESMSAELAIK